MGHKNVFKTISSVVFCYCFFEARAQSLIFRSNIGVQYLTSKIDPKSPNFYDPYFSIKAKSKRQEINFGVELKYSKYSYELAYGEHDIYYVFGTIYKNPAVGIQGHTITSTADLRQIQFAHNRFFKLDSKKITRLAPYAGVGFGLGFNRKLLYEGSNWFIGTDTFTNNVYFKYSTQFTKLSKFSYNILLRAGITYKLKGVERARVYAAYNWNLNRTVRYDISYFFSDMPNLKYGGTSYGKGNNFFIMGSIPIYLKRKK